jgi:class 3 adenylate cyclase
VEEWVVKISQAMYTNGRSLVRVNGQYSEVFHVGVGVHQGSVLSLLLLIIVLEALSREFRSAVPWELL